MVIPMFEDDYKDKSLEELIKARRKLIREMHAYENRYILKTVKIPEEVLETVIFPTPDTIYSVDNDNLVMLTRLIKKKLNGFDWDDDDNIYYYLTVIYLDDSSKKEYNYISEDRTVKEGDIVIVERKDKKVFARVVDARVYKKKDVPYPVNKTKYIEEKIRFEERIEITKENLEEIDYDSVIALTIAEGGAMGEPNALLVVTDELKVYHLNFRTTEIPIETIKNKLTVLMKFDCGFWGTSISEEGWRSFNLGMGNHLIMRKEYAEKFLNLINNFIGVSWKAYELYATWLYLLKEVMIDVWGDNWRHYRV